MSRLPGRILPALLLIGVATAALEVRVDRRDDGVEVQVGASSEDIRQSARFEIQGKVRELSTAEIVFTRVEVS